MVYVRYIGDSNHEDIESEPVKVAIEVPYVIASIAGVSEDATHVWIKGDNKAVVIVAKRESGYDNSYECFKELKVDGVTIEANDYKVKKGSTVVTFEASYLEKLAEGEHTITFVYEDGEVGTIITIAEKEASPSTGDAANKTFWMIMMIASAFAIVVFAKKRRYNI